MSHLDCLRHLHTSQPPHHNAHPLASHHSSPILLCVSSRPCWAKSSSVPSSTSSIRRPASAGSSLRVEQSLPGSVTSPLTHSLTHSLYHSLTALPLHRPRESSCLSCDDVPKDPTQALTNPTRPCLLLAPSHPDPDRRDSAGLDSTRSTVALDSIEPVSGYHCRRRPRGSPPWRSSRRAPTSTT